LPSWIDPDRNCSPGTAFLGSGGDNIQRPILFQNREQANLTDADHWQDSQADTVKTNVPEQNRDHGGKTKTDQPDNITEEILRKEIRNIIIDKAPQNESKTLTPKGNHDLLCVKIPGASLSDIYRICQEEYDKGTLSKHGPGYRYNGGDY